MPPAFDSPKPKQPAPQPKAAVVTRSKLLVGAVVLALVLALTAWLLARSGDERDPNFQPF